MVLYLRQLLKDVVIVVNIFENLNNICPSVINKMRFS